MKQVQTYSHGLIKLPLNVKFKVAKIADFHLFTIFHVSFASLKTLKKHDFIFCKLKKPQKT